jgi:hypothetical protein
MNVINIHLAFVVIHFQFGLFTINIELKNEQQFQGSVHIQIDQLFICSFRYCSMECVWYYKPLLEILTAVFDFQ